MRAKFLARGLLAAGLALAGLPALAALPIQHWTQPGGAKVWFVESRVLPIVDVQLDFDAGSRRDPPAQAGLASAAALMSGKGVAGGPGRPALDENQWSEAWADLGAAFGADAGRDGMSFSLRSLTQPALLERAANLAARQLAEPAFADPVWQRERQRWVAALREADTRPGTVAARAFRQATFGDHPYGQEAREGTLAAIGTADLQRFWGTHIQPCRAKVSVVGQLDRAQVDALVARLLARLPQGACNPLPPVPEVQPLADPAVREIPFRAAQAHVLLGQPGYRRNDPDFFPLLVGNHILGGSGLVSRLSQEVREKRGLTYGVYSFFSPGLHAGAFQIGLQTRPDQAAQALQVARDVLERYIAEGPTEAELQAAKDNLVGGFPLRLDSNRKLLDNVAAIAWHDLPLDYLDTWTAQVARVTARDVREAMARKLQPGRMVSVVLGAAPPRP